MSRFSSVYEPVNELFGFFKSSDPMYRVVLPDGAKSDYVYYYKSTAFVMSLITASSKKLIPFSDFRDAYSDCRIEEHDKSKCGKVDDSEYYKMPSPTPNVVNGPLFDTFNGEIYDQYVRALADHNIYTNGGSAIKKIIAGNKALKTSLANDSFLTAYEPFKVSSLYAHMESYELSFVVSDYCEAKLGSDKKAVADLVNDCKKIMAIIEKSDPTNTISAFAEFDEMLKPTSLPSGIIEIKFVYAPKHKSPSNKIYFADGNSY